LSNTPIISNPPLVRDHLEFVSPSTYGKLRQWRDGNACPLQLLWRGKTMLAPSPAATLGDIVHLVMKNIASGLPSGDVTMIWEEARSEVEKGLCRDFTTRGLVPLARTAKGYELKRQMVLRSIARIPIKTRCPSGVPSSSGGILNEAELVSTDGKLKGKIDLVEYRTEGWVLTDYKSGEVLEEHGNETMKIKESYEFQILLYAHLLKEAKQISLYKAILKTLDGKEHVVNIEESRVAAAGTDARKLLKDFNAYVEQSVSVEDLALPMPTSYKEGLFGCVGCFYRPACKGYKYHQKEAASGKLWPRDAWGKITSISRSDGRVELAFQNANDMRNQLDHHVEREFRISFEDSAHRHPALEGIQVGNFIGVYDYLKLRSGNVAQDGPRTCVYKTDSQPVTK